MEIIFIRHPRVIIDEGICYGQSDIDCCDEALREMEDSLSELGELDLIVTSPLRRCIRVASEVLKRPFKTDHRLLELNFGEWELKSWDEIYQDRQGKFWFENYDTAAPPGGESLTELHARVEDLLRNLEMSQKQKICLIAHAGPIRSAIVHLNRLPLTDFFSISIPMGGVLRFRR